MTKERAVIAIVSYEDKFLVGRKKETKSKVLSGKWHLPAETIIGNETDHEALIRGIKQETGLEIKVGKCIAKGITPTNGKDVKWYECFAFNSEIVVGSDLVEAKWVRKKEVSEICGYTSRFHWPEEIIYYFN